MGKDEKAQGNCPSSHSYQVVELRCNPRQSVSRELSFSHDFKEYIRGYVFFLTLYYTYCSASCYFLLITRLSFHINTFINLRHTFKQLYSIPLYELPISEYLAYICALAFKNNASLSILVLKFLHTGAHISKNVGKITTSTESKSISEYTLKTKNKNKQNFKIPLQVTFNRGNSI